MNPRIWPTFADPARPFFAQGAAFTRTTKPVTTASELENTDNHKTVTKESEHVHLPGGLIPVRVPRSPNSHALPGASPITANSAEEFKKIVQRGRGDPYSPSARPTSRPHFPIWAALLGFSISTALCGCASPSARREGRGSEPGVVTRNFHWVYVTGSNIPVAVPTDPEVQALPSRSPLDVITPDQIRRAGGPMR